MFCFSNPHKTSKKKKMLCFYFVKVIKSSDLMLFDIARLYWLSLQ